MITKRGYFLLAALVLASAVSTVKAQSTASVYSWQNASVPGSPFNTQAAADAAVKSWIVTQVSSCGAPFSVSNTWNAGTVNSKLTLGTACGTQQAGTLQNVNGTNTIFALGYVTGTLPCPAAGTTATRNFTMGYSNSPNDGTDVSGLAIPSANPQCVSGGGAACTGTPGAIKNVWASTEPNAQGLYRISADFEVTFSGASCTQSVTEKPVSDAAATPATCPGAFGTVGGKPVCIPSSMSTRNTVASLTGKTATAGNPPAGSDGSLPYSGRTPASGTNGNDGSTAKPTDGKTIGPVGSGVPSTLGTSSTNSTPSTTPTGSTPSP